MICVPDGTGACGCPKARAVAWTGPGPTGHDEPRLLLASHHPDVRPTMHDLIAQLGLRPGVVLFATRAVVRLVGDHAATLALGRRRIGPMPVTEAWAQRAHRRGAVLVTIGTVPVPADMDADTYLARYTEDAVTGMVPVIARRDRMRRVPSESVLLGDTPEPGERGPVGTERGDLGVDQAGEELGR